MSLRISLPFVRTTLVLSAIYLVLITLSMNTELVINTLLGSFPFSYKATLILSLLQGMLTAMSGVGLVLLILTAVLTGANLTLLWERVRVLKRFQNLHFVVGGNTLLGIVGSGCVACGLPVLSLLGLSGSVLYLPLRGTELSYLAIVFLSFSLFLLLKNTDQKNACIVHYGKVQRS